LATPEMSGHSTGGLGWDWLDTKMLAQAHDADDGEERGSGKRLTHGGGREQMFPGATIFVSTKLVSNLEPVLMVRDPVTQNCGV
jgi:hypothetical protein